MRLTAKTRILIGQMGLLVSVLITAMMLRVVPDHREVVMKGRAALCETLAVNSTIAIARNDFNELEQILALLVRRNEDLLSVGIREGGGQLMVTIGDEHAANWEKTKDGKSNDRQVNIPLFREGSEWGHIEFRFQPIVGDGWRRYADNPWARLIAFVMVCATIAFYFYLSKMLKHLNPSKAVPQRVRSALDTLAEGLLVLDTKGQVVLANERFGSIAECDPEKLVGKSASELNWDLTDEEAGELPWEIALDRETPLENCTIRMRTSQDEQRIFNVNCSPVLGNTGKYRGVLVSFDDVTQLEEQREELAKSKEAADEANRAKSDFLANMSHEIRTPMNAILGFADILRRDYGLDASDRQRYLNTIHSSGKHLLDLINDILDLSKVESGRLEIEETRCSAHEILSDVVAVLRGRADEKGIRLDYFAEAIPETILTDAGRLRQIVTNLVGNAIKFTEKGGVSIRARLIYDSIEPMMAIDIADTGIGMTQPQVDRIFDPFVQADASVTRRFGGTGLGLSISRRLARALGGDILASSEPGIGSTFTVTLKTGSLDDVAISDSDSLEQQRKHTVAPADVSRHLPGTRILLADDGTANRELLCLVLGRAGATIDQAENGQVAVQLGSRNEYDIALMDMQMPVMDGFRATTILRERKPDLPVVALTADAMIGAEERCFEAGCSAFVAKPIDMDQLFRCIKELLEIEENSETQPQVSPGELPADGRPSEISSGEEPRAAAPSMEAVPDDELETASVLAPITEQSRAEMGLPEDETEYRELLETFLATLHDQMQGMIEAVQANDHARLSELAHSLKGTAPMYGFDVFTAPAERLELAAQEGASMDEIRRTVAELIELSEQLLMPGGLATTRAAADPTMESPAATVPENAIVSTLPLDDDDFRLIVIGFVDHLRTQLDQMKVTWHQRDFAELAKQAHWLKGAGGTLGFEVFTEPALRLELQAKEERASEIDATLAEIEEMVSRIVVPEAV